MINPVEVELLLNNYPRIFVTDYLDGFEGYLLAEWKGDLINVPQRVLVSKLAYRYVKRETRHDTIRSDGEATWNDVDRSDAV